MSLGEMRVKNFIKTVAFLVLAFSGMVNAQNNLSNQNIILQQSKTVFVAESQDFFNWQNQLLHAMIAEMSARIDQLIAQINQGIPYPIPRILEDYQITHFYHNDLILVTYKSDKIEATITVKYLNTFEHIKFFNVDWDIRLGISNGV